MTTKTVVAVLTLGLVVACPGGGGEEGEPTGSMLTSSGGVDTNTAGEDTATESTGAQDESGSTGEAESGSTTFGCEQTYYPDVDEDGYGDVNFPVEACLQPPAHIPQGGDCDDANPEVHPGVEEVCDMADNDCDGLVDELSPQNASCQGCTLGLLVDHAYYYCPQATAWPDAQAFCMQLGADLVKIDDQAEQDFLLAEPLPASPTFSIGLSDQAMEGTFVWIDGSAPGFVAWGMGEPNDANMNEDCAQLVPGTAAWNDIDCAVAGAFICEGVGS